ncbi:hypothetical protein ACWEWX_34995 [Streptomyces asiaticus]
MILTRSLWNLDPGPYRTVAEPPCTPSGAARVLPALARVIVHGAGPGGNAVVHGEQRQDQAEDAGLEVDVGGGGVLLVVRLVVYAIESEAAQRGELGLDPVQPGAVGRKTSSTCGPGTDLGVLVAGRSGGFARTRRAGRADLGLSGEAMFDQVMARIASRFAVREDVAPQGASGTARSAGVFFAYATQWCGWSQRPGS